jgi:hypothetical protein
VVYLEELLNAHAHAESKVVKILAGKDSELTIPWKAVSSVKWQQDGS